MEELITKRINVVLIDTNNLSMRNLFVLPYDPTDVKFLSYKNNMLLSIKKIVNNFKPEKLIFCRDSYSKLNWRKTIYPEYKANRTQARDSSYIDFNLFFPENDNFLLELQNCCKNCQFIMIEELEADDLIALITMTHLNWDITLISTDKDFYQLHIYSNFKQYDPIKEKYIEIINPVASLMEKIVRGDKSDNIPPLQKGIGTVKFNNIYNKNILSEWIEENNLQESFDRNTKLIDFKNIPQKYKLQVKNIVDSFISEPFDTKRFVYFITNNHLGMFLDKINDFSFLMNTIK